MIKTIKKLLYPVLFILMGLVVLVFPAFINYFNTDSFLFDFSSFLKDYPAFQYVVGISLLLFGVFGVLYFIFLSKDNDVFVIHRASDGDYGSGGLSYSKTTKGDRDEIVFESIISLKDHAPDQIKLEKKQIKKFYSNLPADKKIAFLGIATMPSLVYAGFVVGENGKSVSYYHWNRTKAKAIRIKTFGKPQSLIKDETITPKKKSDDYVICISTSYQIEKAFVSSQFKTANILYYKLNSLGKDAITNKNEIAEIANNVKTIISEIESVNTTIHLLLACSAELCFAIGQRLNSPALPIIRVYSFDKKELNKWNWCIELKE